MSQVIKTLKLQFRQNNSICFCQISQTNDHSIALREGLLGTVGNVVVHEFKDETLANHEWDKIIRSLEKEGYQTLDCKTNKYNQEAKSILENTVDML